MKTQSSKPKFLFLKKILLILIIFLMGSVKVSAIDEMAELYSRLYTKYYDGTKGDVTLVTSQLSTGRWSDIDYADKSGTNWDPVNHLTRVKFMSKSYCEQTDKSSSLSVSLLAGIEKGLNVWFTGGFTSVNWWYQDIGQQLEIGPILALMKNYLQPATMTSACGYLTVNITSSSCTGANLVWEASGLLIRGTVQNNPNDISTGIKYIQSTIIISSKGNNGIQSDNAFLFHGQQIYNGGYGESFIGDISSWMYLMRGLSMGFSATYIGIIRNLALDGNQWLIRRGQYDFGVTGRDISRSAAISSSSLKAYLTNMIGVDPAFSVDYQNLINHINGTKDDVLTRNKMFYTADYMAHRRAKYHLSVKMCSARTQGTESINGENLKGFWLPFGATCLMKDASEFSSIFPLWDWTRIPGTTATQETPTFSESTQTTTFVGGVSNGQCGVAAMDLSKQSLTAKKSWFMFDNETVCLGAGITSTNANNVNTTLAQSLLHGTVTVDGTAISTVTDMAYTAVKWVFHDNVSYVFPQATNIKVSNSARTNMWSILNTSQPTTPVTNSVFNVWMSHGIKPANASYSYIIVPDIVLADVPGYSNNLPIKILSNTSSLQAVTQSVQKLTGAVFYVIGNLVIDAGLTVSVDQPCALLIDQSKDSIEITVSDPGQIKTVLNVTLNYANSPTKILKYFFPNGDYTGSSNKVPGVEIVHYSQTLPIDYNSFFATEALNTNTTDLVRNIYEGSTVLTPIIQNEWSNSIQASFVSPTVENSTLSYLNYIDNKAGKAIVSSPNRFSSVYSLSTGSEYSERPFYLSALINFSAIRSNDAFIFFSQNYFGTFNRGKLIPQTSGSGFNLGVQFATEAGVFGTRVLNFNTTYLVVLKITPAPSGTETLSVFINPGIGSAEPEIPEATISPVAALTKIQGLVFRATPTGKIAGLRFSNKWADVVKAKSKDTGIAIPNTDLSISLSGKTINTSEVGTIQIYNLLGKKLLESKDVSRLITNLDRGLYIVRFTNEIGECVSRKFAF